MFEHINLSLKLQNSMISHTLQSLKYLNFVCSFPDRISSAYLQWLIAFFTVCFPGAKTATRANDSPWHAFSGIAIFITASISAEAGMVEKLIHTGLLRGSEALLVNFTGSFCLSLQDGHHSHRLFP